MDLPHECFFFTHAGTPGDRDHERITVIGITKKEKGHGRGTRRGWKEHEERVRGICNVSLRLARKKNPEDCPGSCRLKSSHLGKCKYILNRDGLGLADSDSDM